MPGMDIRNFFAKKGVTNKPKGRDEASAPAEKRQAAPPKKEEPKTTKANAQPKQQQPPQPKKKIVIRDSDDDDDDVVMVEAPVAKKASPKAKKASPAVVPNKRKAAPDLAAVQRNEVTELDFVASTNTDDKSKKNKKKDIFAEDSDDDDKPTAPKKKLKSVAHAASNNDESPPTLRSSPRVTASSTIKASKSVKDEFPASTKRGNPAVSSGSAPKPPKKAPIPKRDAPLQPVLELDIFDMDSAAPMCLTGYTFVFTGVMSELNRDEAVERVKILGGRVTGNVSSKTDYLVLGEILEDGRPTDQGSKYKRAVTEPNVVLVNGAAAFNGLLQQYSEKAGGGSKPSTVKAPPAEAMPKVPLPPATTGVAKAPPAAAPAAAIAVNPYAKKANPYAKKPALSSNPYAQKAAAPAPVEFDDLKPAAKKSNGSSGGNQLWVDKYKPVRSSEILGNQDAVRKLSLWLASWEERFNAGKNIGKAFSSPNGPWKAALLSGPPGIGKTTTATLVAQESGRDVLEFNASDVRSKKAIKEEMGDITGSYTLEFRKKGANGKSKARQKRCIIMDEVDGMGAGDRSGMAELIQMIKASRVPIICICNDRQSQKMKSLLPYCMDLRYRRPMKSVIANRAVQVARLEGLMVEQNAAEAIVESCGNDVRQVLNCLQMWSSNHSNSTTMTYRSLKERENSINKDEILRVSLFDAARVIVEGRKGLAGADKNTERTHFFHRNDAYYVDYNFVGLLVQQNYLKIMQPQFNEAKRQNDSGKMLGVLERMHDAAQSMSDWALVDGELHGSNMNWSLLPTTAAMAVKTGYHAGGETGGMLGGFPEFTTWLGRNSSRNKKVRLLSELSHHMNYKISSGTMEMRMSYLPLLHDRFLSLLSSDEPNNVQEAIELMDEYGLDRDDIFEKLDEFNMDPKAGSFQKIDSKKKAAFTRLYNQGSHKSQALVAEQGGGVKKTKRQASVVSELGDPDAIDDDKVEEEEVADDDDELDAEKIKAMFKTKGRGKAAAGKKAAAKPKAKPKATTKKIKK